MTTDVKKEKIIPLSDRSNQSIDTKSDLIMDFVSIMVHDLQAPLVGMKTLIKFLHAGIFDHENKIHSDLTKSTAIALERSESIINDLSDAARAEKVGIPCNLELCNINDILENSISMINLSALEYGILIKSKLLEQSVSVNADRNLLLRVMDNLLFNAFKHSPYGSKVYVEATCSGDEIVVAVIDEGPGFVDIDPTDLFDKYKQMNLRKQGKYKGVGMGLYFCRLVVEAMGGRIWAEQYPGKGACFKYAFNYRKE